MEAISLKPELEIEVLKTILLRENYLKKLHSYLDKSNGKLDINIVNLIDLLRESTIQTVEIIDSWEKSQVSYPNVKCYSWNGENYLSKIASDSRNISYREQLEKWLGFSTVGNPFIIPKDALSEIDKLTATSMVVFGANPHTAGELGAAKMASVTKSPYLTPIINDPEVFQHLSAKTKLDKKFNSLKSNNGSGIVSTQQVDPYRCFISNEKFRKIFFCLRILIERLGESNLLNNSVSNVNESGLLLSRSIGIDLTKNLSISSKISYEFVDSNNELHRFVPTNVDKSKFWSPHEVHLQKQVQRRGGELYVLSAASTKGRLQIPWRQTRFNRMQSDLAQWRRSVDLLGMVSEDYFGQILQLETSNKSNIKIDELVGNYIEKNSIRIDAEERLKQLTLQYKNFVAVSENLKLASTPAQQQLHQLSDGQSRESDQFLSMKLEDNMARKIQILVRKKFGRILRKVEIARRHKAAIKIQTHWRLIRVGKKLKLRIYQLRLALMVQRLYRLKAAEKLRKQLFTDALNRASSLQIQRVFRGFLGRRRLNMKREFIKSLYDASHSVSLLELKPGDIEDLANLIEDYVRDYTITIPLSILSVLRGIFYLTNGDSAECVIISNEEGYTEKKYIYAETSSWNSFRLILRRKGRYLRRLRALVANTCQPNPTKMEITADCCKHISSVYHMISEDEFKGLNRGSRCILQLLKYSKNIFRAYTLQLHFPEYFEPGLPSWFRNIMRIREDYDRSHLNYIVETSANHRIEDIKRIHSRDGKKYSHISTAVTRNRNDMNKLKSDWNRQSKKLNTSLEDLFNNEYKQLATLEAIVRAKTLARDVSEGDLKEYMRSTFIPEEEHLKSLHYNIDMKNIALIQSKTDLQFFQSICFANQNFRDFEKHLKLSALHDFASELGKIKGDLLILLESWNSLLHEIGGVQYIKDLKNEKLSRYKFIQNKVFYYLGRRREVIDKMNAELTTQYGKIYDLIKSHNLKMSSKKWDEPTSVETEFEEFENKECCKRDYETEFRKRRKLENVKLTSQFATWKPLLIVVDDKFPSVFLTHLKGILVESYNFSYYSLLISNNAGEIDHTILELQDIFDERKNVLLHISLKYWDLLHNRFRDFISSLLSVLIPSPITLVLNGRSCFVPNPFVRWSVEEVNNNHNHHHQKIFGLIEHGDGFDILYGKLQFLGHFLKYSLCPAHRMSFRSEVYSNFSSPQASKAVLSDFQEFLSNITQLHRKAIAVTKMSEKWSYDALDKLLLIDGFLALNLSILWEIYTVPINKKLQEFHFLQGIMVFRDLLSRLDRDQFSSLFSLHTFEIKFHSSMHESKFRSSVLIAQMDCIWESFSSIATLCEKQSLYEHPFRYWAKEYIKLTKQYLIWDSKNGNVQLDDERIDLETQRLRVYCPTIDDVDKFCYSSKFRLTFASNIMHLLLETFLVYRSGDATWKVSYNRECLSSISSQSLGTLHINLKDVEFIDSELSAVALYHYGDDVFLELRVQRNSRNVGDNNESILHSIMSEIIPITKEKDYYTFMCRVNSNDLITMLQPNYTEIFDGNLKTSLSVTARDEISSYYKLFLSWLTFDLIDNDVHFHVLRARYLILSKLGKVSGYTLRLEVYEEKFGELRILIFGLDETNIFQMKIDRTCIFKLLYSCDESYERDKLESLNSFKMSYIFANRLFVRPSLGFKHWLNQGELHPQQMFDNLNNLNALGKPKSARTSSFQIDIRRSNGPGRLIGRKVLNLLNLFFLTKKHAEIINMMKVHVATDTYSSNHNMNQYIVIMSIFEIYSDTNVNDLRINLYYVYNQHSVEYRISAMERIMLFNEGNDILLQILQRIRLVYCDLQQELSDHRTFLKLSPEFRRIMSINGDTNQSANDGFQKINRCEPFFTPHLYENEGTDEYYICSLLEIEKFQLLNEEADDEDGSTISQKESEDNSMNENEIGSSWGWALYFDRSALTESRANINVGITFNSGKRGVLITAFEPRLRRESYRFIGFNDILPFIHKSHDELDELLSNIDESIVAELLNQLFALISVDMDLDEGTILVLKLPPMESPDSNTVESIVIARLVQLPSHLTNGSKEMAKLSDSNIQINVNILKASGLAPLESFGGRNPFCVVRYNMREIGRSCIRRNTLNPDWSDLQEQTTFIFEVRNEKMLLSSSIDMEVYDSDAHGKTTDFLGVVRLRGVLLADYFNSKNDNASLAPFKLEKSKKLSESDNQYVDGNLYVTLDIKFKNENVSESPIKLDIVEASSHKNVLKNSLDDYKCYLLFITDLIISVKNRANLEPLQISTGSVFEIVIYVNNLEIHRYNSLDQFQLIEMTTTEFQIVLDSAKPIECRVPAKFPICASVLRLEILLNDNKSSLEKQLLKYIGSYEFFGESLKQLLRGSFTNANSNDILNGSILPKPFSPFSFSISSKQFNASTQVTLFTVIDELIFSSFKIKIRSGRNLPKADLFGKSDPFVKVFFNSIFIGQTSHQTKTLNPNWTNSNEEMVLAAPVHKSADDCCVELHVYDYDNLSEHDLLGVCTISGKILKHILLSTGGMVPSNENLRMLKESGLEFNAAANSFFVPLGRSNRMKHKISPKGEIEFAILNHSTSSSPVEIVNKYYGPGIFKNSNIRRELDLTLPLEQYLTSHHYVSVKVSVSKCLDLVPISSFSTSFRFAKVFFNGRIIGVTKELRNTTNPEWNEEFSFQLCAGQQLKHCLLSIEVFDCSGSTITCLGGVYYHNIVELIASRKGATNNNINLQKSPTFSETETSKTQGSIVFSVVEINSTSTSVDFVGNDQAKINLCVEEPVSFNTKSTDLSLRFTSSKIKLDKFALEKLKVLEQSISCTALIILNGQIWFQVFGRLNSKKPKRLASTENEDIDIEWIGPTKFTVSFPAGLSMEHNFFSILLYYLPRDYCVNLPAASNYQAFAKWSSTYLIGSCFFNDDTILELFLPQELVATECLMQQWTFFSSFYSNPFSTLFIEIEGSSNESFDVWNSLPLAKADVVVKRKLLFIDSNFDFDESAVEIYSTNIYNMERKEVIEKLPVRHTDKKKVVIESAPMNFAVTIKMKMEEENRIFWRGKILPKQSIFASEDDRREILASRASRLIQTTNIDDLELYADVHYLVDYGDTISISNELPVCVREIIKDGPGLIRRYFRVELLSNAGTVLGTADIDDSDDDFRKVAGQGFQQNVIDIRKEGYLQTFFEYAVRERLVLDTSASEKSTEIKEIEKSDSIDYSKAPSSSVIYLLRDQEILIEAYAADDHISIKSVSIAEPLQMQLGQPITISKSFIAHIYSCNQRIVGKSFRTTVFLTGDNILLQKHPNAYFKQFNSIADSLNSLLILFRFKDVATKSVCELTILGKDVAMWLPSEFPFFDLCTKFRRSKFGLHITGYVTLRFRDDGDFDIQFLRSAVVY